MAETLTEALEHHRAGRWDQAELIYRRVLDSEPNHADALHLLGVLQHQRGNSEKALQLIGKAVSLQPSNATYHHNLGEACRAAGQAAKAVEHCRMALQMRPDSPEILTNLGLSLQAEGKHQEALECLEKATRLRPEYVHGWNNLANVYRELGRYDDAIAALRKCLQIEPEMMEAHCNLGQLMLERGFSEEALPHAQKAVELAPDFAAAQNNLGNVLRERGQLQQAKDCYARAIHLQPTLAMAYNNMGQALQEEGKLDDALSWYEQALQRDPQSARFHTNIASVFQARERNQDAIERYRLAIRMDPNYAEAHNGLGFVQQEQGELDFAIEHYRKAIELKPFFAAAHVNLGQSLEEKGDLKDAETCFRTALEQNPNHAGAYGCLATMLRDKLPEEDIAAMEKKLEEDPTLNDGERATLHHGLAHVRDARKEYEEAAEHMKKGNAARWLTMMRQQRHYSPAEHSSFVDRLIAGFTPEYFERVKGWGLDSEVPVFIVGMPRSGTTLLEQVLASHRDMHGGGELRYARDAFESLPTAVGASVAASSCLELLTKESLQRVAQRHLDRLCTLAPDAKRIVDKMPDNYIYLGLIVSMFPKATIIHARRDLRDVALSCFITNFKSIRWACDLTHIAQRMRDYQRLMDHYRKVIPVPILEVDYQDTVSDLEGVARKMVEACGMEWDPNCLEFYKTERPVRTASITQVRQPIYTRSLERWRNYQETLNPLIQLLD